ncbi:MAG: hypothetical protein H0V00_20430 [Chloroflexia bacterium]|nr:hypothetical protein [Chloroflexia bacterium]
MNILLTLLTALLILVFVGALIYFLRRIVVALETIGGTSQSYLAKLGFGVRAIETETGHLAPQVTQLNQGLTALGEGLGAIDGHLKAVIAAVTAATPATEERAP